jgi:hypothetical protein
MLCPNEDRRRLLIENVDKLSKWLDTGTVEQIQNLHTESPNIS